MFNNVMVSAWIGSVNVSVGVVPLIIFLPRFRPLFCMIFQELLVILLDVSVSAGVDVLFTRDQTL